MGIEARLGVLEKIYGIYDSFTAGRKVACKKYCADCCTCNVTLTTLEGYEIAQHLIDAGGGERLERLRESSDPKRYRPSMTFNGLAETCARGDEPPADACDPAWGACPFLDGGECLIYDKRPFGCRCMVSKTNCRESGFADMDPLVLTVNHVCLQFVEHVDARGFSGNLTDVLRFMASADNRRAFCENRLGTVPLGLIPNRPIKVLMVPPEHRDETGPVINALMNIRSTAL